MIDEQLLTVSEVAKQLRISENTVRTWLRSGHLNGARPGGTKIGWRIPASEIARIMRDRPLSVRGTKKD
jgi:excisionase family DNA binding protein